jgi:leucine dehydrogenase
LAQRQDIQGGKAVILGHAQRDKTEHLLRAMGRFIDALNGQYITGEDVGTPVSSPQQMYREGVLALESYT